VVNVEPYTRLAAIIAGACCDQMRRLTETLGNELDIPVIFYGAPRTWHSDRTYFMDEMIEAFKRLGKAFGSELDDERLRYYIEVRNELRVLVNRLRENGTLPAKLLHKIAASLLPAERIIKFLHDLKPELPSDNSIRLMLMGSIPSGKELALIDEMGGQVVADATCLGDRALVLPKPPLNDDPIQYLYHHYIEDNLCPHRRPIMPLIDYLKQLIQQRRVEGVVFRAVKYCHPYGLAATRFRKELCVPFLQLDDDLTLQALGSFRTRIGAFVEMLEARKRMEALKG
jgi:benzoyl-CoA reductase/2-hydroxyglutaryl-CoA dehydratase subunit BcrC/BadD/HgdB